MKISKIHEVKYVPVYPELSEWNQKIPEIEYSERKNKLEEKIENFYILDKKAEDQGEITIKKQWRQEIRYFYEIVDNLLKDPENHHKFVVISDFQVLEIGQQKFELYKKWNKELNGKFFIIMKIEPTIPKYIIDTPNIMR